MEGAIVEVQRAVGASAYRALTAAEIAVLEKNLNQSTSHDWGNVRVGDSVDTVAYISGCTFDGPVKIGQFSGKPSGRKGLPSGLYGSVLRNCAVMDEARVSNCELVENTFISKHACVAQCGVVEYVDVAGDLTPYGNGTSIPVAIGSGGRDVSVYAEMGLEEACQVVTRRGDAGFLQEHQQKVDRYAKSVQCGMNVIGPYATVECAAVVRNVFVGEHALISASHVENSTLLSSELEPSKIVAGSDVRNSLVQWGVSVDSQSIVHDSLMCTRSSAERHGKLLQSILGPYSGVAEGEISDSLVGPFVGFHHQALLIASYWPAGRGNIGYGANVGSNHTGKAPDQELWHGEGCFFGLGVNIKFPSDFTHAPYTLIATGVNTLPQRVTFPFSLITEPMTSYENVSPSFNEIQPGWLLSNNYYSIVRNRAKFKDRGSKSARVQIDFRILRPSTITLMQKSRDALLNVGGKKVYTERDVPGLGKNVMTESARKKAVESYTYFLVVYAVTGLWDKLASVTPSDIDTTVQGIVRDIHMAPQTYASVSIPFSYTWTGTVARKPEVQEWEQQCVILRRESLQVVDFPESMLRSTTNPYRLVNIYLDWLKSASRHLEKLTIESKRKDEIRGKKVIPGYMDAHGTVDSDKVITRLIKETDSLVHEVNMLQSRLLKGKI